ncbi:hypothetical protein BO94DRAFT_529958 [Aspergillus sclerotioniger CBS 115572]|uniref:Uncharacterized protein n=1 Tax=Aspergillus sclerotioniger CBS 115572 TaxID=1450535 RepID=A0A317XHF3_9EURO|nr:hypothetical protein BO94DRAFT_529958 [Aspergillus sclerotioniger CBS 115572]PWY96590.1 hypothetical protein BO94DRAFT_529958 [Aspergillus sclerotioniger CBS 115572]
MAATAKETGENRTTNLQDADRKERKRGIYQTQGQSLDNGEGGLGEGRRREERERGEGKCESKEQQGQAGQTSEGGGG